MPQPEAMTADVDDVTIQDENKVINEVREPGVGGVTSIMSLASMTKGEVSRLMRCIGVQDMEEEVRPFTT